jgi:hypothetical protein
MTVKPPLSSLSPFLNFVDEEIHARVHAAAVRAVALYCHPSEDPHPADRFGDDVDGQPGQEPEAPRRDHR